MFCDINGIKLEISNENKTRKIHKCWDLRNQAMPL